MSRGVHAPVVGAHHALHCVLEGFDVRAGVDERFGVVGGGLGGAVSVYVAAETAWGSNKVRVVPYRKVQGDFVSKVGWKTGERRESLRGLYPNPSACGLGGTLRLLEPGKTGPRLTVMLGGSSARICCCFPERREEERRVSK